MDTPNIDPSRSAQELADDIEAYIDEAQEIMTHGEIVELAELDMFVGTLCERVLHLRADEAQFSIPRFEALHVKLDALQQNMVSVQANIRSELDATNKRQKASRAYRTTPEEKK